MTMQASGRPDRDQRPDQRRDRGSISIEFAIVMSALMVSFFGLMVVAGRIMQQENDVRSAAEAAARAASLEATIGQARAAAERVGENNLDESGLACSNQNVSITSAAGDFAPSGWVTVRVQCTARSLGSLSWLSDNDYEYSATEVIDVYRGDS